MQQSTTEDIMKVVIVDDSVEIQERLLTMLREIPGIEIAGQATTVAQAISTVHVLKPDVMILDLRLPDGSGLDVLRLTQREQIQTRVIVLTSFPHPQYEQRARAAGAYAFLNKAKEFDRVADLVRSLIPGSGKTPKEPVP
jgi:DNA-binding NarL/FixJ family response regulator